MIALELRALAALERVSMRLASNAKRFRRDLRWRLEHENPDYKLTARQAMYLWFIVDRYRRQIPDPELRHLGAQRKLTGELPPIYLEGDLRDPRANVRASATLEHDAAEKFPALRLEESE